MSFGFSLTEIHSFSLLYFRDSALGIILVTKGDG